jgi:hypothetical protein
MNPFIWFILHFPTCFCFSISFFPISFPVIFSDNHDTLYSTLRQEISHSPLTALSHTHSRNVSVLAMFHRKKQHTGLFPPTDRFLAHWLHLSLFT